MTSKLTGNGLKLSGTTTTEQTKVITEIEGVNQSSWSSTGQVTLSSTNQTLDARITSLEGTTATNTTNIAANASGFRILAYASASGVMGDTIAVTSNSGFDYAGTFTGTPASCCRIYDLNDLLNSTSVEQAVVKDGPANGNYKQSSTTFVNDANKPIILSVSFSSEGSQTSGSTQDQVRLFVASPSITVGGVTDFTKVVVYCSVSGFNSSNVVPGFINITAYQISG